MGNIAWTHILFEGWPVLSVLFITSLFSLAIMFEKWKLFSKIELSSENFLMSLKKAEISKAIQFCEKSEQPLAYVTLQILKAPLIREDKERILQRSIQRVAQNLEEKLSFLGTVASVAPFVGLLGTVIGIIKSFHAIGSSVSGGASAVSIGIAEALVGTAGGLLVAIPAVLGYNFFVNKLRHVVQELEISGGDVIDWSLSKENK